MPFPDPLDLILQLDQLVDQTTDEPALVMGLTVLIGQAANADLSLLALPDEGHTRTMTLRAVSDRRDILGKMGQDAVMDMIHGCLHQSNGRLSQNQMLDGTELSSIAFALKLGDTSSGVLLLARLALPFGPEELSALQIATTQIDNALRSMRQAHRLQQETLALRTVLKMDRIRDSSNSLDELLDRGLAELCRVIASSAGYVMLYDRTGKRLELRASTGQDFLAQEEPLKRLYTASDEAIHTASIVHKTYLTGQVRALLGVPLILNTRIIGVLGVINPPGKTDFSFSDRQLLHAIASQMDTAIFEQIQTQRLRETFGRSVDPQVMERLLQIDDRDLLVGERVEISSLFSDIRDFTPFSTQIDPAQLQGLINEHLEAMTRVIMGNEGTLDKFLGDGIMALFNVPVRQPDYARRAVVTALEMQDAHQGVLRRWRANGFAAHPIGIGIATGVAISGNFGSPEHAEYSAIGSCVNLASRLCGEAVGGEILIDERTLQLLGNEIIARPLAPRQLKGFTQPIPVWEVLGLRT